MPAKRRKSGGARAVEQKHNQRNAKRPPGYVLGEIAFYKRLLSRVRRKPRAERHLAILDAVAERALLDPGLPPEQAREQAQRASSSAVRGADLKRQFDDLACDYRELNAAYEELKARHAVPEPAAAPGEEPPPAQD